MNKLWIPIGMMMWMAACGDDAANAGADSPANNQTMDAGQDAQVDSADEGITNNTTPANNASNNNANNTTNNAAANNATNNTTNNAATNNATNNVVGNATCMEIMQCLLVCNTGDTACQDGCKMNGTDEAQQEIDAYLTCVDTLCADATGVTELTECVLNNCGEQQDACLD